MHFYLLFSESILVVFLYFTLICQPGAPKQILNTAI